MPDDPPWEEYIRDRPQPGMSFPAGRDHVERGLRDAGATVGTLDFAVPRYSGRATPHDLRLIDVLWFSDAQSGYRSNRSRSVVSHLFLRVWAVPSPRRPAVRQVYGEALHLACGWAAKALTQGGAWSASEHALDIGFTHGALRIVEK